MAKLFEFVENPNDEKYIEQKEPQVVLELKEFLNFIKNRVEDDLYRVTEKE